MKNILFTLLAAMVFSHFALPSKAQATLEFNRALLLSSTEQTVPADRVWKIEAIYGEQVNACVPIDCATPNYFTIGIVSAIYVNGTFIPSIIRGITTGSPRYSNSTCTTGYWCCQDFTCGNKTADPNILPMWLPEGTVVKTYGSTTFASVIEFVVM